MFSQGFNPTMKISMGIALPLFVESECELVDIELFEDIPAENLKLKLEKVLPPEAKIISIVKINKSAPAIDVTAQWAEYKISVFNEDIYDFETLKYNTDSVLSSEEIFIEKKNKKGLLKKINIKSSIQSYRYEDNSLFIVLKTGQNQTAPNQQGEIEAQNVPAALRADVLMNIIAPDTAFNIKRVRFFDENLQEL